MLDINFIRDNPDMVKKACKNKNVQISVDLILDLDKEKRALMTEMETLKAEQNKISRGGAGNQVIIAQAKEIKEKLKEMAPALEKVDTELKDLLLQLPNIPADDVPVGKDDTENKVLRKHGIPTKFLLFKPKDHVELGEALDLIDSETAGKVSGTRFAYLKNELAILQFALITLAFSVLTSEKQLKKIADSVKKGFSYKYFVPVVPPVMIKPEVFTRMARLSDADKDERYYFPTDDLYLIGSAEHTLGPLYMDKIIQEQDLPLRFVGYSTAFRREAGSYGKDTKGILRVHQFDKVEMESFSKPEDSFLEQEFFVKIQEHLMQKLGIPYQVVMTCTGDMGTPDARHIDIECWMPGQDKYRETHSADLMTDYQARRLNTRIKRKDGKLEFAHMNDATVFAIGRTLIAIMENYQQKDGSIKVPKVLQKYCGFKVIKKK
jgi:seryl-tRNA synthetase